MNLSRSCRVRHASWDDDRSALTRIRREVFVVEQGVPENLEWDEHDAVSLHALALDGTGHAVGTGRLLPDGHIGRMAVLKTWRGSGVGTAILRFLIEQAAVRGIDSPCLHAQTHAIGFYRRQGFAEEGGEFTEAGIPHRRMVLRR